RGDRVQLDLGLADAPMAHPLRMDEPGAGDDAELDAPLVQRVAAAVRRADPFAWAADCRRAARRVHLPRVDAVLVGDPGLPADQRGQYAARSAGDELPQFAAVLTSMPSRAS